MLVLILFESVDKNIYHSYWGGFVNCAIINRSLDFSRDSYREDIRLIYKVLKINKLNNSQY